MDVALRYTGFDVVRLGASVQSKEQNPVSALQAVAVERSFTIVVLVSSEESQTSNFALFVMPDRTAVSIYLVRFV